VTGTGSDLGKSYVAFVRGNMDQVAKKISDDLLVLGTMEVSTTLCCSSLLIAVWRVDFKTPLYKIYLLFISADACKEKEKREESAASHWCFKVFSLFSV
jgi:hypothetical protein